MAHKIQMLMMALLGVSSIGNAKTQPAGTEGMVIKKGKIVYTEITIKATPEKVWQVFSNYQNYPHWNPFIKSLEVTPEVGKHIKVFLQPASGKGMTFTPRVLNNAPAIELRWVGKLGPGYLFDGEHVFQLHDNGNGTTTFRQFERFRGLLVPFMKHMLDSNTYNGFKAMNEQLKIEVEGR